LASRRHLLGVSRGRHVDNVYRYALAVSGSSAEAVDVTMTTLAEAYWSPRKRLTDIAHDICRLRYVSCGGEEESATPCPELELAISRRADGRLGRAGKRAVRAHLPTCRSCTAFAADLRAQRAALEVLAKIPVPAWLHRPQNSRASLAAGRHLYQ
jgi:hypothetical protein